MTLQQALAKLNVASYTALIARGSDVFVEVLRLTALVDELTAANIALAADNARMAKRVKDARRAMAHVMEWNWIDLAIYIDENGADQAQLDFPYTMKDRAEILAFLAGG